MTVSVSTVAARAATSDFNVESCDLSTHSAGRPRNPYAEPTVWYTFDGTGTGIQASVCVNTLVDSSSVELRVYEGDDCSALSCDAISTSIDFEDQDLGCEGDAEVVRFATSVGTTYFLSVSGDAGQAPVASMSLVISEFETKPNDLCVAATPVKINQAFSGTIDDMSTQDITSECDYSSQTSLTVRSSMWFTIQGNGKELLVLSPECKNEDDGDLRPPQELGFSVYSGDCAGGLVCEGAQELYNATRVCGKTVETPDVAVAWQSEKNTPYYIKVYQREAFYKGSFEMIIQTRSATASVVLWSSFITVAVAAAALW